MSNMQRNREGAKSETRCPYFKVLDKIAYDDIPAETWNGILQKSAKSYLL